MRSRSPSPPHRENARSQQPSTPRELRPRRQVPTRGPSASRPAQYGCGGPTAPVLPHGGLREPPTALRDGLSPSLVAQVEAVGTVTRPGRASLPGRTCAVAPESDKRTPSPATVLVSSGTVRYAGAVDPGAPSVPGTRQDLVPKLPGSPPGTPPSQGYSCMPEISSRAVAQTGAGP